MPLYEYVCEQDGSVLELLRPMAEADEPVQDPEGRGRMFRRRLSTFATGAGSGAAGTVGSGGSSVLSQNACCPCGKVGGCGAG
jgi:putative FmdB family regulatory protein